MELGKPVTFIFCILSLYALFMSAFLVPSSDMHQKICDSLSLLMLAAGMSLISGLIFVRATPEPHAGKVRLVTTLPVQLFVWASSIMLVLSSFPGTWKATASSTGMCASDAGGE
jgi:hypothetical protein